MMGREIERQDGQGRLSKSLFRGSLNHSERLDRHDRLAKVLLTTYGISGEKDFLFKSDPDFSFSSPK